jgi:hypothetical protein
MKNYKTFILLMVLGFVGYSLGLWAFNLFYDKNSSYRYLLILLPMLPTLYVVFISVRAVSQCDEMARRIATESMAFSGLATALTCFCYFFFRDMGAPEFKAYWAWSLIGTYYLLGMVWSRWRYR